MKKSVILLCALLFGLSAMAQEEGNTREKKDNTPAAGSVSIGLSVNAMGIGKAVSQPENGTGAGEFVSTTNALVSRQMNMITQDPLASIRLKYHASDRFNLRVGLGFSGSKVNYREYVADDVALANNPLSEKQVIDVVTSDMATVSMIPVMYVVQPQTWTKFEGYSAATGKIESYTDLISPGSNGFMYGTQNIGLNFGLNYYF